jgi:hypothetical protein
VVICAFEGGTLRIEETLEQTVKAKSSTISAAHSGASPATNS